jgi:hypothetical protein
LKTIDCAIHHSLKSLYTVQHWMSPKGVNKYSNKPNGVIWMSSAATGILVVTLDKVNF